VCTFITPIGYFNSDVVYYYDDEKQMKYQFYAFDEEKLLFNRFYKDLRFMYRFLMDFSVKDSFIFYSKNVFNQTFDANILMLYYNNKDYILDTIENSDKKIIANFSDDGKFLLITSLNELLDYYNPVHDNRIVVYDLDSIRKNKIHKFSITCQYCSNAFLIKNKIYYNKSNERDDFSNGFELKDVYSATWGIFDDTVKIAKNTTILAIDDSAQYILGKRYYDLPNGAPVIINIEQKKYQILLGREYYRMDAFYSKKLKKFAYDHKGTIYYIDLPEKFPFNALDYFLDARNTNYKKFKH
jgi:hypothetical protein